MEEEVQTLSTRFTQDSNFELHREADQGDASRCRLLFINQHYWPDVASTGQYLTDLCEYLAAQGHSVEVLCSRGAYTAGPMDVPRREIHKGVQIRRLSTTSFGRSTHLGRIADYASFYARVLWRTLRGEHYDYIVTLTTPPLLSTGAWALRKITGQRYGIWSMDLHPGAEVAAGMLEEDQWLARLLRKLNAASYRGADFVVDLGAYMKERLTDQGVPAEQLHTIPVWTKREEVRPVAHEDNPLRSELGLDGKFVVMYSGNAGIVHRFEEVLEAMRRLAGRRDIHFLFVGGGPRREEIIAAAEKHGVENFQYLDYFPRDQLHQSLSLADVHLLTLRPRAAGVAVPSKLYGIMAAGRPVVMVGPRASEPAETIAQHDIGHVVDPTEFANGAAADRLTEILRMLCERKENAGDAGGGPVSAMGQRGREVFLEAYEREVACQQWDELFERLSACSAPAAVHA